MKNKHSHIALDILYKSTVSEQRQQFGAAFLMLIVSILILIYINNSVLIIIGLVLFVLSIRLGYMVIKHRRIEDSQLYQYLNYQPQKIVWVYSIVIQRMPFGFEMMNSATLYLKLVDGDDISLSIDKDQIEEVMKFLNQLLPHASFGYSKDKEQWYMANPELLINYDA